ncbi:MAG TPA: 2Fe-2S iron-sulfur cluster binding domain-containing protein [Haliangiales bacterium]|nr:2Fe-2S iron-sulfur cluster binding domain-containing protein [Haliangiales bacterium]
MPFERDIVCRPDETILAAALREGLYLRYGCKTGGCSTCKVRLVDGDIGVEGSMALAPGEREAGWILACVSKPLEDMTPISAARRGASRPRSRCSSASACAGATCTSTRSRRRRDEPAPRVGVCRVRQRIGRERSAAREPFEVP